MDRIQGLNHSMKAQRAQNPVVLYHHTDAGSAEKILVSGVLKRPEVDLGRVYLTTKGPDTSLNKLLVNNYDDDKSKAQMKKLVEERGSKAEVCFKLDISNEVFKECVKKCDADGRDVYKFDGDITLSDMDKVDLFIRE